MANEVNDEKQQPKKPIKVRTLQFRGPNAVVLPGGTTVSAISGVKKEHQDSYEITLLPWMRMYRVVTVPASTSIQPKSYLVPESWAIAELED